MGYTAFMSDAEQLRQHNRALAILNTVAKSLNETVDLDQAVRTALAQVADLLGLRTGWVWLLNESSGASYLAAAQNLPPALARDPERMEGSCYCLDTFRDGDLAGAANVNVVTCSRLKRLVDGTDGLRYHASVPLYAHSKKLGVLNVASSDWRELTSGELQLLHTIGDLLGIAVERARLFGQSLELGAVNERNRLAREIHDTLAQGLSALALQLESADALLEDGAPAVAVRPAVQRALALTRANLEEARRSVMDLRAAPLEGRTLAAALAALAAAWSKEGSLAVRFESTGAAVPLPVRVETGLYRMAQEALTNIGRHARAQSALLRLSSGPEAVTLVVEDDGRGFDPAAPGSGQAATGFGLVGINERARLLGGRMQLETAPGAGTRLSVTIPLPGA